MKVDTAGNVYCACTTGVMVFDRTGKHLGTFVTREQPTNCGFGGADWKTLYITCRPALYRVRLRRRRHQGAVGGVDRNKPAFRPCDVHGRAATPRIPICCD